MKYYSEVTHKFYDDAKSCSQAEKEFTEEQERKAAEAKKKADERKARAKEIEDAHAASVAAKKHEVDLINDFIKDYGSYHCTYSNVEDSLNNIFEEFFRFF